MQKSTLLLLLASTATGSNMFATAEALPTENSIKIAFLNEAYEKALIALINTCDDKNNEQYASNKDFIQNAIDRISNDELQKILTQNLDKAVEKAKNAQCENCDLLVQDMNEIISKCNVLLQKKKKHSKKILD